MRIATGARQKIEIMKISRLYENLELYDPVGVFMKMTPIASILENVPQKNKITTEL